MIIIKTTIFIPKRINVGFRNRSDTYTKKLAYIIYYDEKGKLRKETSQTIEEFFNTHKMYHKLKYLQNGKLYERL